MTSHSSLRWVLAADAAGMIAFGLAYLLVCGPIARLLSVAEGLVLGAGTGMLLIGAAVGLLASRPRPAPVPVRLVIAAGAGWVLVSLAALTFGWVSPNAIGTAWIILQAVPVTAFAYLQFTIHTRKPR
ncbi:hypothetical protein ABT294_41840 [Nonomuraea sp. NPDC000554]|uniref:hypothetical protein n=1 Tax=Nonomuraea sp. NPDC000554 TaxID=3154259 RepID=UPI0033311FCB